MIGATDEIKLYEQFMHAAGIEFTLNLSEGSEEAKFKNS